MEHTEMDRSLFQWIAGGFDNKCKVAFAEFPQIPPGTLTSYAVNNIWYDAVAEHSGGLVEKDDFDGWKKFNPDKPPCEGTASHALIDRPQGFFTTEDRMRFWQYVALIGGRDGKCKQPKSIY